ncbi:MAG: sulfatase-like hydrolase/transferase [Candidatus Hydrogenedentes bacterium]|nr:sulfatase-like hydrolase/transferase [Candidatus Hydrogenedentota bacterium]
MSKRITRRRFVTSTTALACAPAALAGTPAASAPQERPNILVIHADQHRMDCLGAYGNTDIRTPHIDALAADGARFDNSFCPYPVCTPSRYSLLCGQYVHQHRGWTNHCTLAPDIETFPRILKRAGYRTKAVGKMHFTPTYLDVGFEEMVLSEQDGPGRWDDDYHRELQAHGLVDRNDLEDQRSEYRQKARPEYWDSFGALPSNLPRAFHSTQWIGDRAVEALEGWGGSGHLLMAGFIKPHHPFDPPKEWCDAYDPETLALLPGWTEQCLPHDLALSKGYFPNDKLSEPAMRRVMAHYYATLGQIDEQVGRMIAILKRKGLYDNALIVYTSDHGEYMGHHHMLLKGNYVYDPLAKVPLIVKYPGAREKGVVSDALVCNLDLAPTILTQAGCAPAPSMAGLDLAHDKQGRDVVFAEHRRGQHAMVRSKTHKLILDHTGRRSLFYDIEKDPQELDNRYDDAAYAGQRDSFIEKAGAWRRFSDLPDTYLDEWAPVIDQPNVPARDDDHRERIIAYCQEKMGEG